VDLLYQSMVFELGLTEVKTGAEGNPCQFAAVLSCCTWCSLLFR